MPEVPGKSDGKYPKGVSGNLKGRPRKANSVAAAVLEALDAKVIVTEGGKRRKISKRQATAKQVVNMGASGNLTAVKLSFAMAQKAEDQAAASAAPLPELAENDIAIVKRLILRLRLMDPEVLDEPAIG